MVLSFRVAETFRTRVHCGPESLPALNSFLAMPGMRGRRLFIIVDPATGKHCLPHLAEQCPVLDQASVYEIEGGEDCKTLATAEKIWTEMLSSGGSRQSLIINLGGGVVSDLGGFVAAGYKRGIPYINIPTSLVGMADAALGGKTGVNLHHLKNQVGVFHPPAAVYIDTVFLKTLPPDHLRSGLAEVIKSALVGDAVLWRKILKSGGRTILDAEPTGALWQELLFKTVSFKNRVTMQDFREKKLRKILNFGHTLGHALEAASFGRFAAVDGQGRFAAASGQGHEEGALLHGDAVAMGMIAAVWLSVEKCGMDPLQAREVQDFLNGIYGTRLAGMKADLAMRGVTFEEIWGLMQHDKKNSGTEVRFTLLSAPGKPLVNRAVTKDEAFAAYEKLIEAAPAA